MQLSISELIASIGCSVSEAQHTIENHSVQKFFKYFDEADSQYSDNYKGQVLSPKIVRMSLSSADDIKRSIEVAVPLPALAAHRSVSLGSVTVKIKTGMLTDGKGGIAADIIAPSADENTAEEGGSKDYGEISLEFNVGDSPEGIARIVQSITKTI